MLPGPERFADFLSCLTLTSLRFLTVNPDGKVPLDIIRRGQRLHLGLLVQHFFLGSFAATPRAYPTLLRYA